jgi:hypothetical protein
MATGTPYAAAAAYDLARDPVVEPDVLDLVAHEAVTEYAEHPGARVVADAEDGVVLTRQALHHAHRLRAALDQRRARVEQLGQQVAHRAVGVVHQYGGRARVIRTPDGRVRVLGHQDPAPLVVPPRRLDVLRVDQPGDSLHVHAQINLHGRQRMFLP